MDLAVLRAADEVVAAINALRGVQRRHNAARVGDEVQGGLVHQGVSRHLGTVLGAEQQQPLAIRGHDGVTDARVHAVQRRHLQADSSIGGVECLGSCIDTRQWCRVLRLVHLIRGRLSCWLWLQHCIPCIAGTGWDYVTP